MGNIAIIKAFDKLQLKDDEEISTTFSFIERLNIPGLNKKITSGDFTPNDWNAILKESDDEMRLAAKKDISILNFLSYEYPQNLRLVGTHKFPTILYVKGNVNILNSEKIVAIIGTRSPTAYGDSLTAKYSKYFVEQGYSTISGLALGTDTNAHIGTIEAGGKTIAILAAGLDQPIYPKKNTELADKIIETGGALVSEYPLGEKLRPQYLAARDEWQSGMADGVIAVETGIKGGTKIAMGHCKYQNRPLAVPNMKKYLNTNDLPDKSKGTQQFISEGLADPLYTIKSVKDFNEKMIIWHKQRFENIKSDFKPTSLF